MDDDEYPHYDPPPDDDDSNLPALRSGNGSIVPIHTERDPYDGIAARPCSEKAAEVLKRYATVPDEWIDIKPNGQIYLPHMKLRAIFDEAFGFMGWGMSPASDLQIERKPTDRAEHVTVYREFRLYAEGRFVRQCMGAGDYYTNNADTNLSDAVEAAESYALNRCGKFLGIAGQCWNKAYAEQWKSRFGRQDAKGWKKVSTAARTTDRAPQGHPERPAPPPAPSAPVPSDGETFVAEVSAGKTAKSPTTIVFSDGGKCSTFDKKAEAKAREAMFAQAPVRYSTITKGNYVNLATLEVCEK